MLSHNLGSYLELPIFFSGIPKSNRSIETRTQVLELGPRDLEPLESSLHPRCILVDEYAFDGEATDEDATD